MTTITQATPKTLNTNELTMLAKAAGPCVTIRVPDSHPGAPEGSRGVLLRQLTQNAATQLREMHRTPEVDRVITSLEQLAAIDETTHGGPGFTLFCSPASLDAYRTPGVREHVSVGEHFELLPHVAAATAPPVVYALGISMKRVRFWRVADGAAEELPVPLDVPESLEAAGGYDKPDHTLENRSSAGPSSGGANRGIGNIRFGNTTDRDAEHMHTFLAHLHRGIKAAVKGAPIFLIGVKEELAEFRKIAKGHGILEAECHAAPELCAADQVAAHVQKAAISHYRNAGEAALETLLEAKHHLSGNLEAITKAAKEGRVHKLVVAENTAQASQANAAVVEALRTGADIMSLPGEQLAGVGIAGAILRY